MKVLISTSVRSPAQDGNLKKLQDKVDDLTEKLNAAKEELAAAKSTIKQKKDASKKVQDKADLKAKGKVSFAVKSATGRKSEAKTFAEGLALLTKSGWSSNGKTGTLTAVTKEGEELLAKKTQKRGTDKPLPVVYLTAAGRKYKNAA